MSSKLSVSSDGGGPTSEDAIAELECEAAETLRACAVALLFKEPKRCRRPLGKEVVLILFSGPLLTQPSRSFCPEAVAVVIPCTSSLPSIKLFMAMATCLIAIGARLVRETGDVSRTRAAPRFHATSRVRRHFIVIICHIYRFLIKQKCTLYMNKMGK